MPQQIRRSQFVFTYGPGAILEGPNGPRIILRPDLGLFRKDSLRPEEYEIYDQRMSQGALKGGRIFRLPSNAELMIPDEIPVYITNPFPNWRLCVNKSAHGGNFYVLYQDDRCPVCKNESPGNTQAIRFIMACPAGHMDDVNWYNVVHGDDTSCSHTQWFRWIEEGSSLSSIRIECPKCGAHTTLGEVYGKPLRCTGRKPEDEAPGTRPYHPGCNKKARIIQRQASNLRIPELKTLFTIPPRHTELHKLLQIRPIQDNLIGNKPQNKEQLRVILQNLVERKRIEKSTMDEIMKHPWDEINEAINNILNPVPASYRDLILEEFHALIEGSLKGIPPITGPKPSSPVLIEIDPNAVRKIQGPSGMVMRVTPVSKLRTVTVQKGYRRVVDTQVVPDLVDVGFDDPSDPQNRWYPGVEFIGEGIFIMADENDGWMQALTGDAARSWMEAFRRKSAYANSDYLFRDSQHKDELHPGFVWWHTLSHFLIRAVSAESGYSSASIRERVYFEGDELHFRGGVLLYATQPGTEGTLGGLISLVPHFQEILRIAVQNARICSGDPLCIQNRFHIGQYNGAACYSCSLLSETSCEHRNMWLDRNVLLEAPP